MRVCKPAWLGQKDVFLKDIETYEKIIETIFSLADAMVKQKI